MDEAASLLEPAAGDEAQRSLEPSRGEVVLEFPVEIAVVGGLSEKEMQAVETRIWESLKQALS